MLTPQFPLKLTSFARSALSPLTAPVNVGLRDDSPAGRAGEICTQRLGGAYTMRLKAIIPPRHRNRIGQPGRPRQINQSRCCLHKFNHKKILH